LFVVSASSRNRRLPVSLCLSNVTARAVNENAVSREAGGGLALERRAVVRFNVNAPPARRA